MPEPDSNDIIFDTYGVDVERLFRFIYDLFTGANGNTDSAVDAFLAFWTVYTILAFLLSALFLIGIIYAKVRYEQLSELQKEQREEIEHAYAHTHGAQDSQNTRWLDARAHADSDNPNDWRLAIIEADIILDELLNSIGYVGTSIGEKLKQASPESFATIDDAWKAHKVRNDIAHRGADFVLTKRIAQETLERYRRVFDEFSFI